MRFVKYSPLEHINTNNNLRKKFSIFLLLFVTHTGYLKRLILKGGIKNTKDVLNNDKESFCGYLKLHMKCNACVSIYMY